MQTFRVFDNRDLAGASLVGHVRVGDDGTVTDEADARSPHGARLRDAVAALRRTARLWHRTEESTETALVMKAKEVGPGDANYGWALTDALRSRYGLRCELVDEEESAEGW